MSPVAFIGPQTAPKLLAAGAAEIIETHFNFSG